MSSGGGFCAFCTACFAFWGVFVSYWSFERQAVSLSDSWLCGGGFSSRFFSLLWCLHLKQLSIGMATPGSECRQQCEQTLVGSCAAMGTQKPQ